MEDFTVRGSAVSVETLMNATETLGLHGSAHETDTVGFEERLEEIGTAMFEHAFYLIETGVVKETIVEQVGFFKLDRGALVANHELLETQETQIP